MMKMRKQPCLSELGGDAMATCFFIGHRDAPDSILDQLSVEVERHIPIYSVTDFIVGSYGWFDSLAAKAVKAAKKRHPEVTLTLLLSYHPYDRPIPTPDGYDGTFYPPSMETVPKRAAIPGTRSWPMKTAKSSWVRAPWCSICPS